VAVTLDAVELNVFTGRLALRKFALAQRGSRDPALSFERLEVRLAFPGLFVHHARVTELALTAPASRRHGSIRRPSISPTSWR
jgi:hypothetical protein